ncbi:SH3 domain-containing protein [Dysgonomonas sp. 511]|uniref:SH3 domain-containing protein n=1 Tax=Dysgonomonas sp. 511 TaxID=2302930 RepID=UPI0013D77327|nr:SH3 domain-containing protein [Dysgonomonas sp. 511]NDV78745.1 SH3 domain-containing protein [Dysgonomonas sp. 511]
MKQITQAFILIVLLLGLIGCKNKNGKEKNELIGIWGTTNHQCDGGLLLYIGENTAIYTDDMCFNYEGKYEMDSLFGRFEYLVLDGFDNSVCDNFPTHAEHRFQIDRDKGILVYNSDIFSKISDLDDNTKEKLTKIQNGLQSNKLTAVINDKDGWTNARKEPNTSSDILYKIYEDEIFYINPVLNGNWYKIVEYKNNSKGWIHKSCVKIISNNQKNNSNNFSNNSSITINSEMDFRAYINNRTFKSLSDDITFRYVNSENIAYLKGIATGPIEVIKHSTYSEGTSVTFLLRSTYSGKTARFSFATPNILFDETGREYRMQ